MLPKIADDMSEGYEVETQPSLTWGMNIKTMHIRGTVDETEALCQAIYCILNTERYDTMIYSWDYGVELKDLYGKPLSYVLPELKRRITEALMQDDRIETVRNFGFDTSKRGVVEVSFTAESHCGEVPAKMEVGI